MNLFEEKAKRILNEEAPLALRMRPQNLDEFVGQEEILGKGKLLRRAIEADRLSSLILYGPPGTGKTALVYVIANTTKSHFGRLNAVTAGVGDIRSLTQEAKERRGMEGKKTILFIDEIHRFNRLQQEALLPDVEEGIVILIGTSVQNPFFAINSALLSRSQIFQLNPLNSEDIEIILKKALKDRGRGLGKYKIKMEKEAFEHLVNNCEGDARRALNALELGVLTTEPNKKGELEFTLKVAEESIQKKAVLYDQKGDAHYDTTSAFIKSMRGSDPDATLYWLAKMLYAGEDPRFIARRIVICAAEDVGNADPQALVLANAALEALEFVGMPEAKIPLAQAAVYIACAPKSNAVYQGIEQALKDVEEKRVMPVPKPLQDAHYPGAARLGRGRDYKYPHNYKGHHVKQEYIPEKRVYYQPSDSGYEKEIKRRIKMER
jgi:putative ATPase